MTAPNRKPRSTAIQAVETPIDDRDDDGDGDVDDEDARGIYLARSVMDASRGPTAAIPAAAHYRAMAGAGEAASADLPATVVNVAGTASAASGFRRGALRISCSMASRRSVAAADSAAGPPLSPDLRRSQRSPPPPRR